MTGGGGRSLRIPGDEVAEAILHAVAAAGGAERRERRPQQLANMFLTLRLDRLHGGSSGKKPPDRRLLVGVREGALDVPRVLREETCLHRQCSERTILRQRKGTGCVGRGRRTRRTQRGQIRRRFAILGSS